MPENLKTAELCLEAVKQDFWAHDYVPKKIETAEIFLEAMKDLFKKFTSSEPNPVSIEENVMALSKQGWKNVEIAKALKISPGEVKSILELNSSASG